MILDPLDFEPEPRPVELHRIRPADITLPPNGLPITGALAIVTQARVYIWTAEAQGVKLRYLAEHTGVDRSRLPSAPIRVDLGGDGTLVIMKGAGCGCGSPLSRFVPWTPVRSGS